ncbi:MAG TPA: glycosyltransferase [Deltaproteobacteria bacterium]|nr:glycosyltransferase [Deltaproteobacteria bacterium]
MIDIEQYQDIVGDDVIAAIRKKVRRLYGKHLLHINSTYQGGGVAEILNSLVPLMNNVGIDTGWRTLHGYPDFFEITKKFHNALQGDKVNLTSRKKALYLQTNERFSEYTHLHHDYVVIHDPQPLALINFYRKRQPWVWRCHVDLSNPNPSLWNFLSMIVKKYDLMIVSNDAYLKPSLPVEQRVIYPAIDPLTAKNTELNDTVTSKYLKKYNIKTDKPLITQISRFDKWKDPGGVIRVFKKIKERVDCRLVLCGNIATDDPEGLRMYEKTEKEAEKLIKKGDVILVSDPVASNFIFINVLQRVSSVIIQKSRKEGFGLVVTEAMWKQRPVVASNVGGIPLQIQDGENGFLVDPLDDDAFADRVIALLRDHRMTEEIGRRAKESVREKFLVTRLLLDYLDLLGELKQ